MPDELLVLGSASGTPTARRFAPAYLLRVTGKYFLIDCGAPVSSLLYRYGIDPVEMQSVFLSHWHLDRVAGLGLFLAQNHQLKRQRKLRVYGPRGSRGKIKRLLRDSFLLLDDLHYNLKITNVSPDKTYSEALLKINFFKTQHLEKPSLKTRFGRKATALGMVLQGPGWRMLYSGDVKSPRELSPYAKKCDLLVHELTHTQPEAVADFAEAAQIPHVLISHIPSHLDANPATISAAFSGRYSGNLMIAEDGTKVRLSLLHSKDKIEMKSQSTTLVNETSPPAEPFLNLLQTEFKLPAETARRIWQAACQTVAPQPTEKAPPLTKGQVRLKAKKVNATGPKDDPVDIILTLDDGEADAAVRAGSGVVGLRRHRIVRLQEEAAQQQVVLTQQMLASLLNVSVKTIRRDLQAGQSKKL